MDNPGLHRLLQSNAAPNLSEAAFIRSQIDDINSRISTSPILEEQLRLRRAVLSPVRTVPGDILGEIFAHSLSGIPQFGTGKHLVNIQLVCKSWRNAARLTHRLWGTVDLSFYDITRAPCEMIQQWLSRAGRTPKSLTFSARDPNDCTEERFPCWSFQSNALASLLVSLEGTLDHLTLDYQGPRCFQKLLNSLGLAAVSDEPASLQRRSWHPLKSFTLKFDEEWDVPLKLLSSMFHHLPPHITSFELYLPRQYSEELDYLDSDPAVLPLPKGLLKQLSFFTLTCDWDGTWLLDATLVHCVNVEILTLDFLGLCCDYPDAQQPRLLHKVRTLRLRNVPRSSDTPPFALETPQLVELDVDFEGGVSYISNLRRFSRFIQHCSTTLRLLRLRNARIGLKELTDFLLDLPSLTHLYLDCVKVDSEASVFDALIAPEGSLDPFLPNLETLELLLFERADLPSGRLLAFLESRIPHRVENGQAVSTNSQGPFKRLKVMYYPTEELGENQSQELDGSKVEGFRKRGVFVDFVPIFHVE